LQTHEGRFLEYPFDCEVIFSIETSLVHFKTKIIRFIHFFF
jgi:hypothetical protein